MNATQLSRRFRPAAEPDLPEIARILSLSFGTPPDASDMWVKSRVLSDLRVLTERETEPGATRACLLRIPMGQYFGGRAVPTIGIAAVGVPPESRGCGLAREMMAEAVREIAAAGMPLSTLFASTQSLYRQVGFEQGGHRFITTINLQTMQVGGRDLPIRPLDDQADHDAVVACYTRFASAHNGMLQRGQYVWDRIRRLRDTLYRGFCVPAPDEPSSIEGYLYLSQNRDPDNGRHNIEVSDVAFTTPRAARRLLALLADFTSMGLHVEIPGAPLHPLTTFLPQQRFECRKRDWWMLRVCNIVAAFESRGYSAGVSMKVDFDVEDGVVTANSGKWTLSVDGGRGRFVRRQGDSRTAISTGPHGLAAVYSGLHTPLQAAMLGLLSGPDESLRALEAVFNGGAPWMTDHF